MLVRPCNGLNGRGKYPLTQALVDLEDYYNAGTIPGAIVGITASANENAKKASDEIKVVALARVSALMPQSSQDEVKEIGDAIEGLNDLARAKDALGRLGHDLAQITDIAAAKGQIVADLRMRGHDSAKIQEMHDAFKKSGLIK